MLNSQVLQCEDVADTSPAWPEWTGECGGGNCVVGFGLCGDYECGPGWFAWPREWAFYWDSAEVEGIEAEYADRSLGYELLDFVFILSVRINECVYRFPNLKVVQVSPIVIKKSSRLLGI